MIVRGQDWVRALPFDVIEAAPARRSSQCFSCKSLYCTHHHVRRMSLCQQYGEIGRKGYSGQANRALHVYMTKDDSFRSMLCYAGNDNY